MPLILPEEVPVTRLIRVQRDPAGSPEQFLRVEFEGQTLRLSHYQSHVLMGRLNEILNFGGD